MSLAWLKPLLLSSSGAAVIFGVGIAAGVVPTDKIFGYFTKDAQPSVVETAQPAAEKQASVSEEKEPVSKTDEAKQPEAKENNEAPAEVASTPANPPTFDVMRVEKDGSILVAGNAQPNATIELISGDGTSLASTQSGPAGDFVLLPSNPLAPGSYSLSIKSTGPDGQVLSPGGLAQIGVRY